MYKRAAKYFPLMSLLKKIIFLMTLNLSLIESGLENVTSPAGAKGFGKSEIYCQI